MARYSASNRRRGDVRVCSSRGRLYGLLQRRRRLLTCGGREHEKASASEEQRRQAQKSVRSCELEG